MRMDRRRRFFFFLLSSLLHEIVQLDSGGGPLFWVRTCTGDVAGADVTLFPPVSICADVLNLSIVDGGNNNTPLFRAVLTPIVFNLIKSHFCRKDNMLFD